MPGPTIASAEVDVDFDGRGMPAQARRIANQAGKVLAPKMKRVGDRAGRAFIAGMDGQIRQIPANALRAIRKMDLPEVAEVGDRVGMEFIRGMDGQVRQVPANALRAIRKMGTKVEPVAADAGDRAGRAFVTEMNGQTKRVPVVVTRAIRNMSTTLEPVAADAGDRAGRAFVTGMNGHMNRVAAPALRAIRKMGTKLAPAMGRVGDRVGQVFVTKANGHMKQLGNDAESFESFDDWTARMGFVGEEGGQRFGQAFITGVNGHMKRLGTKLAPVMAKVGHRVGQQFVTGVDGQMKRVPVIARRAIRNMGTTLEPQVAEVGDRVGREFITGMDGQLRQVPANAMRAIRQIDTRQVGRDKGAELASGLGDGLRTRLGVVSNALARSLSSRDFGRRGRVAGDGFSRGFMDGLAENRSRIAAAVQTMLSGIGGGSGGNDAGTQAGDDFGDAFHKRVGTWGSRTARLIVRLIATIGPQLAALGSALSGTLVGAVGSAIVGLGGALLALGGPLTASILAFKMLKTEWKHLLKSSAELKASVKGLSEAWKEQKTAMAEAAIGGIMPLIDALSKLIGKSDFGEALGKSVATIAGAFTDVVKSPGFSQFLTAMETTFPAAMTLFGTATASITAALLTMWTTAGPAAVAMGESFAGWAANFADAMQVMADSGQLADFFDTALASLDALFGLLNPLTVALGNVFLIGAGPANDFLGLLGFLSERFLAFTRSAEGVTEISQWFEQANVVAVPLVGLIGSLGKTLAAMVTPTVISQLVGFINSLSAFLPIVGELLSVIGEDVGLLSLFAEAMTSIGIAIQPILPALSEFGLILGQGLISVLLAITPALSAIAGVFGQLLQPLGQIVEGLTEFSSGADFARNAARLLPVAFRNIGNVLVGLVDTIAAALPEITTGLAGVFTGLGHGLAIAFRALGPAVGNLLGVVVEQLAMLLPVVVESATVAFGGLVDGLKAALPAFIDAMPTVVEAVQTLVPMLLGAALDLVIALVEGLAANSQMIAEALLGVLTSSVDAITEALPLFVSAAVDLVGGLAAGLLANLPALVEAVGGLIGAILLAIGDNLPAILLAAVEIVGALAIGLRESGPAIVDGLLALLPAFIAAVDEMMPTLITVGTTILNGLMRGLIENETLISLAVIEMTPAIIKAVENLLPLWIELGLGIVDGIAKGIEDNPELAVDAVKTIVAALIAAFMQEMGIASPSTVMAGLGEDVMYGLRDGVILAGETVITYFRELPGKIMEKLSGLGDQLRTWASDAMERAKDGFQAGIDNVVAFAKGIPGQIAGAIGYLGSTLYEKGANLIKGLVEGFTEGIPDLLTEAGRIAGKVIATVTGKRKGFDEHSPSRVFRDIGLDAVAGLTQGLEKGTRSATDAAAALARGSITSFDNAAPLTQVYGDTNRNNNVAAGAIQIFTQTTDPVIAANMVLDRLVTRMA